MATVDGFNLQALLIVRTGPKADLLSYAHARTHRSTVEHGFTSSSPGRGDVGWPSHQPSQFAWFSNVCHKHWITENQIAIEKLQSEELSNAPCQLGSAQNQHLLRSFRPDAVVIASSPNFLSNSDPTPRLSHHTRNFKSVAPIQTRSFPVSFCLECLWPGRLDRSALGSDNLIGNSRWK